MTRHADALYQQLEQRYEPLRKQFDAVDTIHYRPDFADACDVLKETLRVMKAAASP